KDRDARYASMAELASSLEVAARNIERCTTSDVASHLRSSRSAERDQRVRAIHRAMSERPIKVAPLTAPALSRGDSRRIRLGALGCGVWAEPIFVAAASMKSKEPERPTREKAESTAAPDSPKPSAETTPNGFAPAAVPAVVEPNPSAMEPKPV